MGEGEVLAGGTSDGWHMLAVRFDGLGEGELFRDGLSLGTATLDSFDSLNLSASQIELTADGQTRGLDDVFVAGELTNEEIAYLAAGNRYPYPG